MNVPKGTVINDYDRFSEFLFGDSSEIIVQKRSKLYFSKISIAEKKNISMFSSKSNSFCKGCWIDSMSICYKCIKLRILLSADLCNEHRIAI